MLHQQSKADYDIEELSDSPFAAAQDEEETEPMREETLQIQKEPESIHQEFTLGQSENEYDKPELVYFSAPTNKPPNAIAPPTLTFQPLSSGLRYSEGSQELINGFNLSEMQRSSVGANNGPFNKRVDSVDDNLTDMVDFGLGSEIKIDSIMRGERQVAPTPPKIAKLPPRPQLQYSQPKYEIKQESETFNIMIPPQSKQRQPSQQKIML